MIASVAAHTPGDGGATRSATHDLPERQTADLTLIE